MVVGVCGFGYSGSGAVMDLLREYPLIKTIRHPEFSFIYRPDGLEDLERAIVKCPSRFLSSDSAIRRFKQFMKFQSKELQVLTKGEFNNIIERYLSQIIQVSWNGSTTVHLYQSSGLEYIFYQVIGRKVQRRLEKLNCKMKSFPPYKKMYYSYMGDDFYVYSKELVNQILSSICHYKSDEICVLDQPFSANDPSKSFVFFDNPKAIVVLRDPRDLYLLCKTTTGFGGSFIPTDSVEEFVRYYQGMMLSCKLTNNAILTIQFEDLIYFYDSTKEKIEKFLGIDDNNQQIKKYFIPEVSINNTQLFNRFLNYDKEIEYITQNLSDYLYKFPINNRNININSVVF